jgi:hypothetical protein
MAINGNSYGSAAQVAALSRRFTNNGVYDGTTNPTLSTVEGWIDQISATLNVSLAAGGFAIPITQADCVSALSAVVVEAVAELCRYANSTGRFYTERALENGIAPMKVIRNEMRGWVEDQTQGFIALGAEHIAEDKSEQSLTAGVIGWSFAEHDDDTSGV